MEGGGRVEIGGDARPVGVISGWGGWGVKGVAPRLWAKSGKKWAETLFVVNSYGIVVGSASWGAGGAAGGGAFGGAVGWPRWGGRDSSGAKFWGTEHIRPTVGGDGGIGGSGSLRAQGCAEGTLSRFVA